MAKTPTPEEAIERAQRAQEARLSAIRSLAEARQNVTDVREDAARQRAELDAQLTQREGDAERHDMKAYNAAVAAGWSADELRKIGFDEPDKKARTRKRAARKSTPKTSTPAAAGEPAAPVAQPEPVGV